jgi:hypothetical protein
LTNHPPTCNTLEQITKLQRVVFEALVEAIVKEVRLQDGHDPSTPIPPELMKNIKLRIKGWVNSSLNVVPSDDFAASYQLTAWRSPGS